MIYLDSSALIKLLADEDESAALERWLGEHPGIPLVASELVRTEVVRAARRLDERLVVAARALVTQLDLVPLDRALLDAAAGIGEPLLRSLDAIHLASAMSVGEHLDVFVAYDRRLAIAATDAGLQVQQPGSR